MYMINTVPQLGALIQKTRKKQSLTQAQLASICGVGIRFIRELEKGKESCYIGKAMHVLYMLGLSISVEDISEQH